MTEEEDEEDWETEEEEEEEMLNLKDIVSIPLHMSLAFFDAARVGNLNKVTRLLPSVNINSKSRWGYTALMYASEKGQTAICRYLVDQGADTSIRNDDGEYALNIAQARGHSAVVQFPQMVSTNI